MTNNLDRSITSIEEYLNLSYEDKCKIKNVIVKHGKPIGICSCNGNGMEGCFGNGWINRNNNYTKCPKMTFFEESK